MVLYLDLDSLPASTLRHLAALREGRERTRDKARYIDYQAMAEELAMMLCEGRRPTVGWYRRQLRPHQIDLTNTKVKSAPLGGNGPPAPPASIGTDVRAATRVSFGDSHAWAT
jgi:hypothetical protein